MNPIAAKRIKKSARGSGRTIARHPRSDGGWAFIPDPESGPAHTFVDMAEALAEHFVASATAGQEVDGPQDEEEEEEAAEKRRFRGLSSVS